MLRGRRPAAFLRFLSTPSARRATPFSTSSAWSGPYFYPRPPRGGRRQQFFFVDQCLDISIHALREEGDQAVSQDQDAAERFLSTPSARRATAVWPRLALLHRDFYPRPPRGGRPANQGKQPRTDHISIHALREEGDVDWDIFGRLLAKFLSTPSARRATTRRPTAPGRPCDFYPRPPRGGRLAYKWLFVTFTVFLSTPSARRATPQSLREREQRANFYPRPPRGGRRFCLRLNSLERLFLSTPSARRATSFAEFERLPSGISIHALREEGDPLGDFHSVFTIQFLSTPSARRATSVIRWRAVKPPDFYPRPPRGGRRPPAHWAGGLLLFLSTPSARRATAPHTVAR